MGLLSKLFRRVSSSSPLNIDLPSSPFKRNPCGAHRNNITCAVYSVRGKNPATGRMKREDVVVESTASEEEIQKKSGLLPPYEIAGRDPSVYNGPTENQLAYAEKLGITFPDDATVRDASVFISRCVEERTVYAPPMPDRIVRLLISKNVEVPAYAGIYEAANLYLHGIDLEERLAFFAMRVYCSLYGKKYYLLEDAPEAERKLFFECARKYQGDNAFVRSVLCYDGTDLPLDSCKISKKLKAYDMAVAFFGASV